ncbi:hypothetical protein GF314_03735 [bacterium]|nr:hypothetical protein [bacterium]
MMHRSILALILVVVASGAVAQYENAMGIFFEEDDLSFWWEYHNLDTEPGVPFEIYVAILGPSVNFIGGYECSLEFLGAPVFMLGWGGPDAYWQDGSYHYPDGFSYGGFNFGDEYNHLVGYSYPVPTGGEDTVLAKMRLFQPEAERVDIYMGPSEPSSVGGDGPAIANGLDPDEIILCTYTSGPYFDGWVGTLNAPPPVTTEAHSWSGVKALFE